MRNEVGKSNASLACVQNDELDDRLAIMNDLQASKVKSLMGSIDSLKKENLLLKRRSQEHRRTDAFKQVQVELGRQDVVIEALRREVGDNLACEAVREVVGLGPDALDVPKTREELALELEDIRKEIATARRELDRVNNQNASTFTPVAEDNTALVQMCKMVEDQHVQIKMLQQENESLETRRAALTQAVEEQRKLTEDVQREKAQRLPKPILADVELEGRLKVKEAELDRTQLLVQQLKHNLQATRAREEHVAQQKEDTESTLASLRGQIDNAFKNATEHMKKRIHDQEELAMDFTRKLERIRPQLTEAKLDWRTKLHDLERGQRSQQQQDTDREKAAYNQVSSQVQQRFREAQIKHKTETGKQLSALEAAEAQVREFRDRAGLAQTSMEQAQQDADQLQKQMELKRHRLLQLHAEQEEETHVRIDDEWLQKLIGEVQAHRRTRDSLNEDLIELKAKEQRWEPDANRRKEETIRSHEEEARIQENADREIDRLMAELKEIRDTAALECSTAGEELADLKNRGREELRLAEHREVVEQPIEAVPLFLDLPAEFEAEPPLEHVTTLLGGDSLHGGPDEQEVDAALDSDHRFHFSLHGHSAHDGSLEIPHLQAKLAELKEELGRNEAQLEAVAQTTVATAEESAAAATAGDTIKELEAIRPRVVSLEHYHIKLEQDIERLKYKLQCGRILVRRLQQRLAKSRFCPHCPHCNSSAP